MLNPSFTKQFEKDIRNVKKRNKNLDKLKNIIKLLTEQTPLPEKYKNHKLIGNYKNRMECHIEPNWLLIYKIFENEIIFERTGSHADLF
ncbi:MAG: type II toxin-antitoxin system YafQ family toxin [Campylobacteraceae bacterium]|nr:type II toxin-antitoxin system YafQ family toxin [Campylobacteraceae bacterium]